VSFNIYDSDGDGVISKEELATMVAATMREHEIVVSDADIAGIVNGTLAQINQSQPEAINYEE
jgi:Ca2+-binding EF-hand superfamily protein